MARILVFTAFYLLTLAVSTYSQDFLSIDCGADEGYTDDLGIEWVTDDAFIQTGNNVQLRGVKDPVTTLRYFPEGRSKNCYVLPVKNETTYLLRTQLYAGRGTSRNENGTTGIEFPVDFNVTLDNLLLTRISANSSDELKGIIFFKEAIFHTFDRSEMNVCLVKGRAGFPFLNTLEMRELPSTAYSEEVKGEGRILISGVRLNTGTSPLAENLGPLRYPDDPYDRFWIAFSDEEFQSFERPSRSVSVPSRSNASEYNWPPAKVLADAWVDFNLLQINLRLSQPGRKYFAFYLQEIRPVNFTDPEASKLPYLVDVDGRSTTANVTTQTDVQVAFSFNTERNFSITLGILPNIYNRTSVLNGFEVLLSNEMDSSAISSIDSSGLKALQTGFGLQDWTGDPCYPVAWNWLTCDTNTSRVVKLELSNMTLNGSIPEEISILTELTEIRLNNNNLTGSIPESIGNLTKLEVLALDNNNLTGQIPLAFLNRTGFTFAGNPGLCPGGQNCDSAPSQSRSAAVEAASVDMRRKIVLGLIVAGTVALLT